MKFGVVVFPGTWSDCDFHHVVSEVLHQPVKYVWHRERDLGDVDCVILPGGFSYGDYLRAGAIAGRSPVVDAIREFAAKGSLENIAGVINEEGTVLGLMPHPERAAEAVVGGTDGLLLFQSLLGSLVEDGTFLKR